ncbi:MAG: TIGR02710 family CRISPR-associated protein [Phycisphaerae bacterium]|nr:TIGR02710 family CRISPR-associated protein [Phycisphaerae bacterium]
MKSQTSHNQHILLICTVGGTPDPLVRSLLYWQPDRVVFVPSQQTHSQVDTVLLKYAEHAGRPLSPGCYRVCLVADAEDLSGCLQTVRSLAGEVQDWSARGDDFQVVADLTGGTKCLSAALALQARRWRCRFSYVGGERRTKDGVGVVEAGAERLVHYANPWDALGYQAVEDAVAVFNHGGYAAAAHLLEQVIKNTEQPEVKRELATLKALVEAYAAWDRFDHKTAKTKFADAWKNQNDLKATFPDASNLIGRIQSHDQCVAKIADSKDPTIDWVHDLLDNAHRRAAEHRFDDAVARLYRAIEALAQIRLREQHGISDTKKVSLDKLPPGLREEWKNRARDGAVMLGLRDAYRLLKELGDELGCRFAESELDDDERSPLGARNDSILAHGFVPVGDKVYKQLWERACKLADYRQDPDLDWRLP